MTVPVTNSMAWGTVRFPDGSSRVCGDSYASYYDKDNRLHRTDGPAIESVRTAAEQWFNHGKLHRIDGPAIIHPDGRLWWYINGVDITEEFKSWVEDFCITRDWTKWNVAEKTAFRLRFV